MIQFSGTPEQALAEHPDAVHLVAGQGFVEVYFDADETPSYAQLPEQQAMQPLDESAQQARLALLALGLTDPQVDALILAASQKSNSAVQS